MITLYVSLILGRSSILHTTIHGKVLRALDGDMAEVFHTVFARDEVGANLFWRKS